MGIYWQIPPEEAFGALADAYIEAIQDAIYELAQAYKPRIKAWMKANAPWTDRSGHARQTLYSEVEQLIDGATEILFAHGMDYGIWLELAHGGNWAIIGPAIDHFAPLIWADVQALVAR